MLKRVPTGIPGFDKLCKGGLPKSGTYLVSGVTESGKTLFAMQFLVNGARMFSEAGVFITTEEKPQRIRERFSAWQIEELEDENKLAIIDASLDLDASIKEIAALQNEINAKRAVFDSATAIGFSRNPLDFGAELLSFSTAMRTLGLTSVFTCQTLENKPTRFCVEQLAADGLILLHYMKGDFDVRGIEIIKIRGSDHSKRIHPLEITEKGIIVYPENEVFLD